MTTLLLETAVDWNDPLTGNSATSLLMMFGIFLIVVVIIKEFVVFNYTRDQIDKLISAMNTQLDHLRRELDLIEGCTNRVSTKEDEFMVRISDIDERRAETITGIWNEVTNCDIKIGNLYSEVQGIKKEVTKLNKKKDKPAKKKKKPIMVTDTFSIEEKD